MTHCIFVGNLVKDPQLDTISGKNGDVSVVKFKIGVNNRQRNESTFPYCEAWGKGAEMIAEHFRRGDLIRVYCSLVTDTWPDKQTGETQYRDKFRVERFEFVESRRGPATDETDGNEEEPDAGEEEHEAPETPRKREPKPSASAAKGKDKKKSGKPVTAPVTRPSNVEEDSDGEGDEDEEPTPF